MLRKYCKNKTGIKSDIFFFCSYFPKKGMFLKLNLIKFSVMLSYMKNLTYTCTYLDIYMYDFSYVMNKN